MSALISLNPMATTNAAGLFNVNSNGYTQGDAQDDPAVKFQLAGGVLATNAAQPVWGGVPVQEVIQSASAQPGTNTLGDILNLASGTVVPTGICVFNQAFQGITTPQSNVPLYSPGMSINFYRFGSGARIPLVCDAGVVGLGGSAITTTVYYNYTTGVVTTTNPGAQAALPVKIVGISPNGNKTVSFNSGTNTANWVYNQPVALCLI